MGTLLIRVVDDTGKSRHVSSVAEEVATGVAVGVVAAGVAITSRPSAAPKRAAPASSVPGTRMHVTRSRLHCARDGVLFFSSWWQRGIHGRTVSTMVV